MSSPNGHEQEQPHGQNSYQPGQQPPQTPAGQDTYAPEEDIPRQQAPREDQYAAPGQGQQVPGQGQQIPGQGQQVPGQGQQAPGQDAGYAGGQQGTYNAYPPAGGYYPGGARPLSYLDGAPVGFGDKFGCSVAISGTTAVVGASETGLAYVFTKTAKRWKQVAELNGSDTVPKDELSRTTEIVDKVVVEIDAGGASPFGELDRIVSHGFAVADLDHERRQAGKVGEKR